MTFTELYQNYFGLLWSAFQYDVEVFSQGWIYYWALMPATFYFAFFMMKWSVLLAPLWLPFAIPLSVLRHR